MGMKKVLVLLAVLVAVTWSFAAYTIGLSLSTLNNPFFVELRNGAQSKAKELGVNLIVVDAQDKPSKQINDIEDLIQKKVDLIIINPTDSSAIVPAIESANKAKIPVITVDRGASGLLLTTYSVVEWQPIS